MRKLVRGEGPHCLTRYRHGVHRWSLESPTPPEREQVWEHLRTMQGTRCAYCEADIGRPGRSHIEHFRQRDRHPQGTFDWSNLFGSCNREDTCGKFKDACGPYEHSDLLKPDVDEPDDFFIYVNDGTIAPRDNLDEPARKRAIETLRIFNLDAQNGALREMRREAIRPYLDTAQTIMEMLEEFSPSDIQAFIDGEIQNIAHLPFATSIRHTLSVMA
ncbi:retron Ec78 anti-phage system effector HNH endonuclease PtuB [Bacillus subtilis]|uniref:retron Ec78 anti-phage system effector HNH endonuclease PtuB n=1 Tax=Pseudomonas sp. MWU12-2029 TaxID=2927805 RepID=UPI0021F080C4|nr:MULTISPECIES: retron Ec78 anti-phage system effector HNH endonuclease PtuB [unclassified Pseudomonas]MDL5595580.1 retron Ec78 anti-phage system effector HNH endonuclease PtuB [Bacillus subtilis]